MGQITGIVNEIKTLSPEQEGVKNVALAKMQTLEQLKYKRQSLRDDLKKILLEDGEYRNHQQKTDEERKKLRSVKDRLAQRPDIFKIKEEIKDLNESIKETKADVSQYLLLFQSMTGQLSFINPVGQKIEIVQSATPKIVKVEESNGKRK